MADANREENRIGILGRNLLNGADDSQGPASVSNADTKLPPVTIVIEWENAIDVDDEWTNEAMAALEREIASVSGRLSARPRIMYLYDSGKVEPGIIDRTIDAVAPRLRQLADVEIMPTPGLAYYQLKNLGISRSTTDISIMLDTDAAPQPGWLENLVKPFADPKVMIVGGFTIMAHTDLLSKTMALIWLFDLPEERAETVNKVLGHANNCAVRTAFFRDHPFPDVPMFKKHFGMWLRDLVKRGYGFVRTADAMTVHAPHPGFGYILWRGWQSGSDRDFLISQKPRSRLSRIASALGFFARKTRGNWSRIARKGGLVGLPAWQRPFAMLLALCYRLAALAGEIGSALSRTIVPIPASYRRTPATD